MQMAAKSVFNDPQVILHPTAHASAMFFLFCELELAVAVSARQHVIEQTIARLTARTMQADCDIVLSSCVDIQRYLTDVYQPRRRQFTQNLIIPQCVGFGSRAVVAAGLMARPV